MPSALELAVGTTEKLRRVPGWWHLYHDVVPSWLVEFATKQVLPNVIKGVRKRVKGDK